MSYACRPIGNGLGAVLSAGYSASFIGHSAYNIVDTVSYPPGHGEQVIV